METRVVGDAIVCPLSRHIAAPLGEILEVLKGRICSADREKFDAVSHLAEASTECDFLDLRRRVKCSFRLFSDGALGKEHIGRIGRGLPSKADFIQRELRFVSDFLTLMQTAHYELLTKELWDMALREDYELTMPIKVNLTVMDSKMLMRFWSERPSQYATLPEMANRMLIFYRGVSIAKKRDLFISEKIDLLVTYLITNPLIALWNALSKQPVQQIESETKSENDVTAREMVKRVSLRALMPDWKAVLRRLFVKVEVSEPTFDSVVVLYRKAKATLLPSTPNTIENFRQAKRNIVIKMFDSVPSADLELIFPEKVVNIRTLSWIIVLVTSVVAVVSALITLWQTDIEMAVIGSALTLVLGKLFQSYTSMQREKATMMTNISKMLYEKTRDAQDGALFTLLDDMADQHLKHLCVAYFTLFLATERKLSIEKLDEACEAFFREHFGRRVDFCLREKLPHLLNSGLVKEDPTDKDTIVAVDLDTAIVEGDPLREGAELGMV